MDSNLFCIPVKVAATRPTALELGSQEISPSPSKLALKVGPALGPVLNRSGIPFAGTSGWKSTHLEHPCTQYQSINDNFY